MVFQKSILKASRGVRAGRRETRKAPTRLLHPRVWMRPDTMGVVGVELEVPIRTPIVRDVGLLVHHREMVRIDTRKWPAGRVPALPAQVRNHPVPSHREVSRALEKIEDAYPMVSTGEHLKKGREEHRHAPTYRCKRYLFRSPHRASFFTGYPEVSQTFQETNQQSRPSELRSGIFSCVPSPPSGPTIGLFAPRAATIPPSSAWSIAIERVSRWAVVSSRRLQEGTGEEKA